MGLMICIIGVAMVLLALAVGVSWVYIAMWRGLVKEIKLKEWVDSCISSLFLTAMSGSFLIVIGKLLGD